MKFMRLSKLKFPLPISTDGPYNWPGKEYICDVDDTDVLKMSIPSEDILSGKAAIVRVKLSFDSDEIV